MDDPATIDDGPYRPRIAECLAPHSGMDELVILGVTHKTANSMDQLSSLVIPESEQESQLAELREVLAAEELVYISTCNRVSFIIISGRGPAVLLKVLRSWFVAKNTRIEVPPEDQWVVVQGRQALEHLLLVASSLDSMVVGERQILGQFKQAFIQAKTSGLSGPKIQFLYEQTLTIAKQVYTNTSLSEGKLSVASLAETRLSNFCARHKKVTAVLVGAGKMIDHVASFLAQKANVNLVFVNRTKEKSDAFVEQFGGSSLSLESFLSNRTEFDILASSTSAPHYLFGASFFESGRHGAKRLVIDFAIPPDVEPAVGEIEGVTLINMDSLRKESTAQRKSRSEAVHDAQRILTMGANAIVDRWKVRSINPAIGSIRKRYERETLDYFNKLVKKELRHLDQSEKEALEQWIKKMSKHWAIMHASGIKEVARHCCRKAVSAYLDGLGVDQADE